MKFDELKYHAASLKDLIGRVMSGDSANEFVGSQYVASLLNALTCAEYLKAVEFIKIKHGDTPRKHTNLPYWTHPITVANILVLTIGPRHCTPDMVIAALLHDTVEDTDTTLDEIEEEFGPDVRDLVDGLTDPSKPSDGNREARKKKDREHLAKQGSKVKTIRCADILHNSESIIKHDPDFAKVWMEEKRQCLPLLMDEAHPLMYLAVEKVIDDYFDSLETSK